MNITKRNLIFLYVKPRKANLSLTGKLAFICAIKVNVKNN